jgi:hypothetical protein
MMQESERSASPAGRRARLGQKALERLDQLMSQLAAASK